MGVVIIEIIKEGKIDLKTMGPNRMSSLENSPLGNEVFIQTSAFVLRDLGYKQKYPIFYTIFTYWCIITMIPPNY